MTRRPVTSDRVLLRSDEVDFWQTLKSRDEIEKSGPRDFRYFGLVSETVGIFLIG